MRSPAVNAISSPRLTCISQVPCQPVAPSVPNDIAIQATPESSVANEFDSFDNIQRMFHGLEPTPGQSEDETLQPAEETCGVFRGLADIAELFVI